MPLGRWVIAPGNTPKGFLRDPTGFLGVPLHVLWPERYDDKGNRLAQLVRRGPKTCGRRQTASRLQNALQLLRGSGNSKLTWLWNPVIVRS